MKKFFIASFAIYGGSFFWRRIHLSLRVLPVLAYGERAFLNEETGSPL
jgi:hypothetical protein